MDSIEPSVPKVLRFHHTLWAEPKVEDAASSSSSDECRKSNIMSED